MTTTVISAGKDTNGIFPVHVSVKLTSGIGIHYTGLRDENIKLHLLRTVTAMQSLGYHIPGKKILVNISADVTPADASVLDLPVALAIVSASGQADLPSLGRFLVAGELGMDGSIRKTASSDELQALAESLHLDGCVTAHSTRGQFSKALELLSRKPLKTLKDNSTMRTSLKQSIAGEIIRLHVQRESTIPDLASGEYFCFPISILDSAIRYTDKTENDIHFITRYIATTTGDVCFVDEKDICHPCEDFADEVLTSVLMMLSSFPPSPSSGRRTTFIHKILELGEWKPQHPRRTSALEIQMLQTHFEMESMNETDLRNLRDMIVMYYSRKGHEMDIINTINSITAVIDHTLASRGVMP
jgi:hypothetical protein